MEVVEEKEEVEVEESSRIDDASVCPAPPTADMTEVSSSNDQQQEELLVCAQVPCRPHLHCLHVERQSQKMDNQVPIDIEEVLKSSGVCSTSPLHSSTISM